MLKDIERAEGDCFEGLCRVVGSGILAMRRCGLYTSSWSFAEVCEGRCVVEQRGHLGYGYSEAILWNLDHGPDGRLAKAPCDHASGQVSDQRPETAQIDTATVTQVGVRPVPQNSSSSLLAVEISKDFIRKIWDNIRRTVIVRGRFGKGGHLLCVAPEKILFHGGRSINLRVAATRPTNTAGM